MAIFQIWLSAIVQKIKLAILIGLFPAGYIFGGYHMAKFYDSPVMKTARFLTAGTETVLTKTGKAISGLPFFEQPLPTNKGSRK